MMAPKSHLLPWNSPLGGSVPKERRIVARIPKDKYPDLELRLAEAARIVKVDKSVLILAAVEGICSAIEKYGEITFPLSPAIVLDELGRRGRIELMAKRIAEGQKHKK